MSPTPATTDETTDPAAASSAGSSTSDPFVGNAGPGFDPDAARRSDLPDPTGPSADDQPVFGPIPEVEEDQVRSVLANGGDMLHALVGVGEYDLVMTQADLNRIAPPLTRIINRYEPARAVAGHSDEAAVAIGFGMYGWRTALERKAVKRAREDQPVPGEQVHQPAPAPAAGPVPEHLQALSVEEGYTPLGARFAAPDPEGT